MNSAIGQSGKSVAFQNDIKYEGKSVSMPKLDDRQGTQKFHSEHSAISPGYAKVIQNKKGQLNHLVNSQSIQKFNFQPEYKSSQGFYLNENLINPHNQYLSYGGGGLKAMSSTNLKFQNGSQPNLSSNNRFTHSEIKSGNDLGYKNNGGNIHSSRDQYGSQTALGNPGISQTNRNKWSQEQVYTTFYKKSDNNGLILIPDKFWQQEKTFVPFKKIWSDHEQQNLQMVTQYIQKKEQMSQEDERSRKFKSSSNLDDEDEYEKPQQMQNSIVVKKKKNNIRFTSTELQPLKLPQTNKQLNSQNLKVNLGINKPGRELNFNKNKIHKTQHDADGYQDDNSKKMTTIGSLSNLDEPYQKSNQNKYGITSKTMNNMPQNNSIIDPTQKDEIDMQLQQNRYSQNVYGVKILEVEQQVYNDAIEKIQQNQQQLNKMQKKTRVYNKNNLIESLDDQNKKNNSAAFSNERELAIQRPNIICCWIENDQDMWKPQPRMGSTISIAGPDNKKEMILIGGISSEMVKDVIVINPETYQYQLLKNLQEQRKQEQEEYQEEMQRRKQSKDRKMSKMNKRGSLNYNLQVNGNPADQNTPGSQKNIDQAQSEEKQQNQNYEDLFNKYMYGKDNFSQRYNHTTVQILRKTKLLIFGGEILNPESHQQQQARQKLRPNHRNCLNDLISFDTQTYEWRAHMGRGEIIEARRNHTANMVGQKHMVVIGGLNSEGRALEDIYVLDISNFRWINISLFHNKYIHAFPQGIAYHAACFVVEDEYSSSINILSNAYYNAMNQNNLKDKKSSNSGQTQYIKEEGLYLFGGIDSTQTYIKNKMFVLKQNASPPAWIELNTLGKSPERRCMHSLNFMYNMSIIAIYGGKFESQNSTKYFDDLHVLNLKNLEWIQVNLEGNRKPPRAMHTTCVNHKQLIVFGGLNDKGFLKGNFEIIEFDQMIVLKMKRQQNFSLTLHQELTTKQQIKHEDPLMLELMQKGENKDKNKQLNELNMQKMKDRVFLIDPEQEREIKKGLDDLKNTPQVDILEEKWKPPQKSNGFQSNKFQAHSPLPIPAKTYLPIPLSILKKKDM